LKYAAISASQALNHHFWLLQLFHCYQCCHVQRQGKLQAMKDTKGSNKAIKHTMKDQVKATMESMKDKKPIQWGGRDPLPPSASPKFVAHNLAIKRCNKVRPSWIWIQRTMELPQEWCALVPVGSKTEPWMTLPRCGSSSCVFHISPWSFENLFMEFVWKH